MSFTRLDVRYAGALALARRAALVLRPMIANAMRARQRKACARRVLAIIARHVQRSWIMQNHIRHLMVVGRVQGVGFRHGMGRKAAEFGIRGWVRNRLDGRVEAMIQGTPDAVAAMIAWARHGPRSAVVERVEVEPGEGEYDAYEMRPTE